MVGYGSLVGSPRGIALIIGALVLVVGLVGFSGAVPGLSVGGCGNPAICGAKIGGVVGISPQFTVNQNVSVAGAPNLPSVILTDHTILGPGLSTTGSVVISWGDSKVSAGVVGGSFPHSFAAAGTYSVVDTVSGHVCLVTTNCGTGGPVITGTLTRTITVSGNGTSTCGGNGGTCGKSPTASVAAAFSWSANGLGLSVTDHSTVLGATESGIVWKFGDGSTGSGMSMSHTYALPGSYNVTEIVLAQTNVSNPNGATVQGTASNLVPVAAGNVTNGSTASTSLTSGPSQFANPLAAALVAFGVVEIIVVLVWKNNLGVAAGVVLGLVAAGAAYVVMVW